MNISEEKIGLVYDEFYLVHTKTAILSAKKDWSGLSKPLIMICLRNG